MELVAVRPRRRRSWSVTSATPLDPLNKAQPVPGLLLAMEAGARRDEEAVTRPMPNHRLRASSGDENPPRMGQFAVKLKDPELMKVWIV